ncbi:HAMP domain-containing sensor histidine kinase [Coraliomargarita algicola]|uniref:histidine kinase n=1 Tax=Coraliomargarita algicola TaxID=3092156 RepID=A0ABZ0RFB0_9BACT|nr:HAMP domain-containing sensor histidine kinase [Coraliomargarita sp. J2-16]WPJ94242.1 HAMP domain-containing sensor histidine kinase [Coraliomargarita sp. J2-16]
MDSNTPPTQFNGYPLDSSNGFIHGSPTDEEIRLQALNHSKDKLLSLVGHDLRSAIGGVLGIVRMLDQRLEQNDIEEAKRLSGLIYKAGQDAEDLLKDLVAWTRNSGQELKFRLESIDILQLLNTEVDRLHAVAHQKKQRIKIDAFDSGIIRADPYMLQAIFRNLLTNAIKFSHQGGEIKVCIYRQPGLWEFQVKDKGVGMTEDTQALLLKIDGRKQKSGTSGEMGSGFGLLLCEDFIQRHGGHLTWESATGEGTTFSFTIPELLG